MAQVARLPEDERRKLAWVSDLPDGLRDGLRDGLTDGAGSGATAGFGAVGGPSRRSPLDQSRDEDAAEDGGGQRWDLDGCPILASAATAASGVQRGAPSPGAPGGGLTGAEPSDAGDGGEAGDAGGEGAGPGPDAGLHHGLHHHGREPEEAGYTLDELCVLARSLRSGTTL